MSITVRQIIEAARDVHPAFDERQTPDRVLVRHLSAYQRELLGKIAAVNESLLMLTHTVALPLVETFEGETQTQGLDWFTLPARDYLNGLAAVSASGAHYPVRLVPWGLRFDAAPFPSAFVQADRMYLRGLPAAWTGWKELVVTYVPVAPELTALADTFTVPDVALAALRASAALMMGKRGHAQEGLPPIPLPALVADFQQAEEALLRDLFLARGAEVSRVREVRSFA